MPLAVPTARVAPDWPIRVATSRYDRTWTAFDAAGVATLIATYKDGVLDGPWRQFVDGVVVEGAMTAGRRTGTWTQTDRAGVVSRLEYKTP